MIINQVNNHLAEKLFGVIRQIIVEKQKESFIKSVEYTTSSNKHLLLTQKYKEWYKSISSFFLSYHSIYALVALVDRELQIRGFEAEDIIRVKSSYIYDDIEFSATYAAHYTMDMQEEIEDCIEDLQKNNHIVDNYKPKKDTEKTPPQPLTNAQLKYSAFYLLQFEPQYTSHLADILFNAKMITNPNTNGWGIDDDIVEMMIILLNTVFKEEQVLQYKRTFTDKIVDRDSECIRPVYFTEDYFPKNLKTSLLFTSIKFESKKEQDDSKKLYEFIYYLTLATQMRNSIYDTSTIDIVAGSRTLKAQANEVIKGQENWEVLLSSILKRIAHNSDTYQQSTVILPEVLMEEELKNPNVYPYSHQSKRPPRYGIGRFITQILEKNNIGSNSQHDDILNELISSRAVIDIKSMLYPQENSIILILWLREHIPLLVDLEYMRELDLKIESIENGEISIDSLLSEIDSIIESGIKSSGVVLENSMPSQAKLTLFKKVIAKNNLRINFNDYKDSNTKIDMILAQYPLEEAIKVGLCPKCNFEIHKKERINESSGEVSNYYICEKFNKDSSNGCNFFLWDSYIYNFFSNKKLELFTPQERMDALKKILPKKRGYLYTGLVAKNEKTYDAKVFLAEFEDKKTKRLKWGFSMKFQK